MEPENNKKERTWAEKRRDYKIGTGIFLFLFLFSFISAPKKEVTDLVILKNKIINSISYHSSIGTNSSYEIRIKLRGDERRFDIDGADYQNFNHLDFKKEVSKGDTVSIKYAKSLSEFNIYSFKKGNKDFCDLEKSNKHKDKNDLWLKILTGYAFIICLIPLMYDNEPKIHYGTLLIIGLILLGIILSNIVGCEYITFTDYKSQ